jgi:hypothetical protein
MYEMMDPQAFRQRRGEMLREAERGRVAAWKLEWVAGRLLKPLRRSQAILMPRQSASDGIGRARRKKYG